MTEDHPSAKPPAAVTPTRRGPAVRGAILDAVSDAVSEVGYLGTTVDGIAARANSSKATIYRYWPGGKPELVAAALQRNAEGSTPPLTDTGTLRGDLVVAVRGIVIAITGRAGPSLMGLLEAVRDDSGLRAVLREQIRASATSAGVSISAAERSRGAGTTASAVRDVMMIALSCVLTSALLEGAAPDVHQQERIVDEVLVPLLRNVGEGRP